MRTEREQWNRLSTNDKHTLRSVALVLDGKKVYYRITNDNIDYPPTLWAWCDPKWFYSLLSASFGIHRR